MIKPLSTNKQWAGRRFKTKEYEAYEWELSSKLPKMDIPKNVPLRLILSFGFSSKASDLSNAVKATEDIICKKYRYDDKWHFEIYLYKEIVKKGEEFIQFDIEIIKI